jgi:hypothetical protein
MQQDVNIYIMLTFHKRGRIFSQLNSGRMKVASILPISHFLSNWEKYAPAILKCSGNSGNNEFTEFLDFSHCQVF